MHYRKNMQNGDFSKMLNRYLEKTNFTKKQAAMALGVSRTSLNNYLNGIVPGGMRLLSILTIIDDETFARKDANPIIPKHIADSLNPDDIQVIRKIAIKFAKANQNK